jgi:hypothetical protein
LPLGESAAMSDSGNGHEHHDDLSKPTSMSATMKRADTKDGEAPASVEHNTEDIEASIDAGGRVVGASDHGDPLVEGPNSK